MDKKKLLHDLILLAACLFVSLFLLIFISLTKSPGSVAVVTVDGEVFGEYPLLENQEVVIETDGGRNVLVISEGYADMTDASCPDGLCCRQRRISAAGESIVCLPNKVVVTVRGDGDGGDGGVDLEG